MISTIESLADEYVQAFQAEFEGALPDLEDESDSAHAEAALSNFVELRGVTWEQWRQQVGRAAEAVTANVDPATTAAYHGAKEER